MRCVPKPTTQVWGGVVFKTIGFFIANEVSPRFDHLVKEDTGFIGFKIWSRLLNIRWKRIWPPCVG